MEYSDGYFTNRHGLKLHYRDYDEAPSDSPVVLCMPGLTRNANDFQFIAEHLHSRCRLICAEQRGRGGSDRDPDPTRYAPIEYVQDMFELLAHLKLTSVYAIGTSLGGMMAMMMHAARPGIFKGVVINDVGPELDPKGIERIKSYVGKGKPPENWVEAIANVKNANRTVYPAFTDDDWDWFTRLLFKEENGKPVAQYDPAIANNFNTNSDQAAPDLWPIFAQMYSVPLVVLRGELSDLLSAATLDRMAREHPNCTAVTVANVGHVPLMREANARAAIDALIR